MEKPVKGDVVVVPFPFSDLSKAKRRPSLVVAALKGNDVILCQITSRIKHDVYSIPLENIDFQNGSLPLPSHIRPNRLFTADTQIVIYKAGTLAPSKTKAVEKTLIKIFAA